MSDSVAKLYADLGFKVDQDGLKQFKSILKDFASQMNKLNSATKEAAEQYGIFSKDKAKQAMADEKLATQQARTEEVRVRTGLKQKNQAFKEEMAIRKADFNERLKEEREKERIARAERAREEKSAKERRKILREALHSTGEFAKKIGSYLSAGGMSIGRLVYGGVRQSLGRSISTRDFMLATGAGLGDIQSVVERFANIGISANQETIMSDLLKLSQSMAGVAMGKDASAYKLLSTSIRRGDISGMLKGITQASKNIDPDFMVNLLGQIGLPSYWLSFLQAQGTGKKINNFIDTPGQKKIEQAQGALVTLSVSFKNLADWIAAALSPVIVAVSEQLQDWSETLSEALSGEGGKRFAKLFSQIIESFAEFLKALTPETVFGAVKAFVGALEYLASKIIGIARFFGYETEEDKKRAIEQLSKDVNFDLKNPGRSKFERAFFHAPDDGLYRPAGRALNPRIQMEDRRVQNITNYGVEDFGEATEGTLDALGGPSGTYNAGASSGDATAGSGVRNFLRSMKGG